MDYWRLAQYWIDRDQDDKALEIVKEGIEKGEGRKEELYLYMQEHHERHNDYDAVLVILKSKIQEGGRGHYSIGSDEAYKSLMEHYESTGDYSGIVEILDIRLANESRLDFEFYQEAKKKLKEDDWPDFESRFIARAKKKERFYRSYQDDSLLAQIYDHKGNTDDLWRVVRGNPVLLREYEDKLVSIYPEEYLEQYQGIVAQLIKNRGRENYRSAVQYAERIKHLCHDVLKEPERWETYIQELRTVNKKLRAMQDEFSHL